MLSCNYYSIASSTERDSKLNTSIYEIDKFNFEGFKEGSTLKSYLPENYQNHQTLLDFFKHTSSKEIYQFFNFYKNANKILEDNNYNFYQAIPFTTDEVRKFVPIESQEIHKSILFMKGDYNIYTNYLSQEQVSNDYWKTLITK